MSCFFQWLWIWTNNFFSIVILSIQDLFLKKKLHSMFLSILPAIPGRERPILFLRCTKVNYIVLGKFPEFINPKNKKNLIPHMPNPLSYHLILFLPSSSQFRQSSSSLFSVLLMILLLKQECILELALCQTKYYNHNIFTYFLKVCSVSLIFFAAVSISLSISRSFQY